MQEKKDREENLRNDIFKEIEEKQKTRKQTGKEQAKQRIERGTTEANNRKFQ